MKNNFKIRLTQLVVLFIVSLIAFSGCKRKGCTDESATNYDSKAKKDDGSCTFNEDSLGSTYDFSQELMLATFADQIFLPRLKNAKDAATTLNTAVAAFTSSPSSTTLTAAQEAFITAYKVYERIEVLQFGPGEDAIVLRSYLNTFPLDTVDLMEALESGEAINFEFASNMDINGFPALDYLLFGRSNTQLVDLYTTETDRVNYLLKISLDIQSTLTNLETAWLSTGGNYVAEFKTNSTGSASGSSLSLLGNQFALVFELTKTYRLLVPIGTLGPLPDKCEGYYSGISRDLVTAQLESLEDLYYGKFENSLIDSIGFEEYMIELGAETLEGTNLNTIITTQFTKGKTAVLAIPNPMSETLLTNKSLVSNAYTELQKNVGYIKRDMMSEMGVMITYADSDGD